MKKTLTTKKLLAVAISAMMCGNLLSVAAFAKNDNTGTGQTEARIHLDQSIGNGDVTITVGENTYSGTSHGSQITIEMNDTDNGFDIGKDQTMEIGYQSESGSGTITISHQEGNGTNIDKEHDNGLNNFRGSVSNGSQNTPSTPSTPDNEPSDPVTPSTPDNEPSDPTTPSTPDSEPSDPATPVTPVIPVTPIPPVSRHPHLSRL